jgi:RNA polymerase sigma-70 factor (ECF subfamily)
MTLSDAELMSRVAAKDRGAFGDLYDRYAARAFGMILHVVRNRTDAEDVLQETFLQVWNHAGRFDAARSSVEGWVILLARSRALDRVRRQVARPTAEAGPDRPSDPEPCVVERAEDAAQLGTALARIPAEQQDPIRLAFYHGYTHEEIARRLGLPLGTVKTRIRLGLMKLRDRLSPPEVSS